uniref:BTB domain-containing protein n=1 Tax=Graphocephala atropunctata TaxID=36148 RepID=A0A1B6MPA1_9HEMI
MAADHFCLRWNNYQSNMVSELDILRSEEHLVDVTLSCEGQKFRAHKVILSACSAYFRNVFKENPCEHPVVILKDVNYEDVEALLSFVYQGVVYVSEKKLASFLQTAELLQIKGLTGAASTLKDENLSDKTSSSMPNKPVVPPRKVLPSVSPPSTPPTKRRKGAPVRICKPNEEAEDSDNNSQRDDDDQEQTPNLVKQERTEETDHQQILDNQPVEEDISMEAEGEVDSNESVPSTYPPGETPEVSEDGEVKREEATLLERSLVAASMSRQFESQGSFPPFPVTGMVPGNAPLAEQVTPTGSHLAQCGNCPHCGQKYSNQSALKYHVRLMHSDLTNRLCCYLCPRSFVQREQYKVHMWEKHKVRW